MLRKIRRIIVGITFLGLTISLINWLLKFQIQVRVKRIKKLEGESASAGYINLKEVDSFLEFEDSPKDEDNEVLIEKPKPKTVINSPKLKNKKTLPKISSPKSTQENLNQNFNQNLQKAFSNHDFSKTPINPFFDSSQPLIHLHIGKNGGTSFDSSMGKIVKQVKNGKTPGKFIGGQHFDWAYLEKKWRKSYINENHPERSELQVVLLMRDPIDRAISHYYFHQTKTSRASDPVRKYKKDLNGYLNHYQLMLETRDVWQDGQAAVSWLTGTHIARWVQCPVNEVKSREMRSMNITDMLLNSAINLRRTFWFGNLHDVERSLELLAYQLQIDKQIFLSKANGNKHDKHESNSKEDQLIRRKLERLMPQDIWLYKYSKALFDARFAAYKTGRNSYVEPPLPFFDVEKFYTTDCRSTRFILKCGDVDSTHKDPILFTNTGILEEMDQISKIENLEKIDTLHDSKVEYAGFRRDDAIDKLRNVYHLWSRDKEMDEYQQLLLPFDSE